jgi:uroporphyrinogen-III synthase
LDSSVDTVRIKKILFSQNLPTDFEKTPYAKIAKRYNVEIDFFKFFQIEGLTVKSFLSRNISILNHTAIILTSKNAIDHFFSIINKLKITLPITTKYFCVNDAIANYLRKYIIFRSRKTFYHKDGKQKN